jgi:probable addiction module antidote protein
MKKKYRKFTEVMDNLLQDPKFAADFLSEALEQEDFDTFLLSLKDVIRVHGSIAAFAEKAQISRTTLYNLFASPANPELRTILTILHTLGYTLTVTKKAA